MRLNQKTVAFFVAWTITAEGMAYSQSATTDLQKLVETSAQRLVIAEQVSLAKWDGGKAVDDASRKAQVIESAIRAGESRGLDQASVSNFFRAQIEASKLVQYSLIAEWRRNGKAADHKPVNLVCTIRPELDKVDTELIAELAETAGYLLEVQKGINDPTYACGCGVTFFTASIVDEDGKLITYRAPRWPWLPPVGPCGMPARGRNEKKGLKAELSTWGPRRRSLTTRRADRQAIIQFAATVPASIAR